MSLSTPQLELKLQKLESKLDKGLKTLGLIVSLLVEKFGCDEGFPLELFYANADAIKNEQPESESGTLKSNSEILVLQVLDPTPVTPLETIADNVVVVHVLEQQSPPGDEHEIETQIEEEDRLPIPSPSQIEIPNDKEIPCKKSNAEIDKRSLKNLYKCNYCPKTFASKGSMRRHILTHTRDKEYKCDYCEKTFLEYRNKIRHQRIHTGEKPYKCDYCDKSFALMDTKTKHHRTHTGEKPFKCDYCDKTFSSKFRKSTHHKMHTSEKPYKCDYCDERFRHNKIKISHQRIHTREKPYRCGLCDKTFAKLRDKKHHELEHTARNDPGTKT